MQERESVILELPSVATAEYVAKRPPRIKWYEPRLWEWLRHSLISAAVDITRAPGRVYRAARPDHRLTRKEVEALYGPPNAPDDFKGLRQCVNCGGWHQHACPRVKSYTFAQGSSAPTAVEFWPDGQWPKSEVLWPWQVAAMIKE